MSTDLLYPAKRLAEDVIGVRGKKWLKYAGLRARMALGQPPFTNVGGIDRQVLPYVGTAPGFFIEAGGNDGIESSTSYYFERELGWSGFLVEPVPQLAAMARRWRRCPVHEVALGAPELRGHTATLNFADGMSRIDGSDADTRKWAGWLGRNPTSANAPFTTLSDLIEQAGNPAVTLLTLDVETYELEVLKGLDLSRHAPRVVVVETLDFEGVGAVFADRYDFKGLIGHGDMLFVRR